MLQFISKALTLGRTVQRLPLSFNPATADFAFKTLHQIPHNDIHSKQKIIVKYRDELLPFSINHLWDNDGTSRISSNPSLTSY